MENSGDPAEGRKQAVVEFLRFHCNFVTPNKGCCNKPIKTGWITACSHLFCYEHMQEWFSQSNECPICRAGEVRLVQMDFSRGVHNRSMRTALLGMMPTEIVQATETALTFWLDQKVHEFKMRREQRSHIEQKQKRMEEHIKTQLVAAERNCNKMEEEQRQVLRQINVVDQDIGKAERELKEVNVAMVETEERYNSLQKRISGNQRQEFFSQPFSQANIASPHIGMSPHNGRHYSAPPTPSTRQPSYGAPPTSSRRQLHGTPHSGRPEQGAFHAHTEWRRPSFDCFAAGPGDSMRGRPAGGGLFGSTPSTAARPRGENRDDLPPPPPPSTGQRRRALFTPGCVGAGRITKRRIT